eukprot:SAG31_NODE_2379_length_5836_cov_4.527453_4_plen_131_part_00
MSDEAAWAAMPIESFGGALLRGMGWQPGKAIGLNSKGPVVAVEYVPRHQRLGLGATPKPPEVRNEERERERERESERESARERERERARERERERGGVCRSDFCAICLPNPDRGGRSLLPVARCPLPHCD